MVGNSLNRLCVLRSYYCDTIALDIDFILILGFVIVLLNFSGICN